MEFKTNNFTFEWDETKNFTNISKHGISFETAVKIFEDENRVEIYDIKHSISEDRFIVIGIVEKVLTVVYTERKEKIRIISARCASKKERRIYKLYGDSKKDY